MQELRELIESAKADFAAADQSAALEDAKARYIGKSGAITALMKELGKLPPQERRERGQQINAAKTAVEAALNARREELANAKMEKRLAAEAVDVTLPGREIPKGALHPVIRTWIRIEEIFHSIGFDVADGPEIESDWFSFTALNNPPNHPARSMQDTFYVDRKDSTGLALPLRPHTSPMQVRYARTHTPPIKVIVPGRTYRVDSDATHSPMFHQVEGLLVDKHVTMADLRGTLTAFMREVFGSATRIRFRPSFFPFTEPSAEADISCCMCGGKGHVNGTTCRVCKGTGWLEILGCGLVDREVFKAVGYDPEEVTGFAFGLGVERIAMLKYGIGDLRMFFENDVRFLGQFA